MFRQSEVAALLAALCAFAPVAVAQAVPPLAKGARVRVVTPAADGQPARHIIGSLVRLQGDTVVIAADSLVSSVVLDGGRRLEVSTGSYRNAGKGAALGVVFGALTGGAIGAVTWEPCTDPISVIFFCFGHARMVQAAAGAVLGVAGGALVGLVIGASIRTETWAPQQTTGVRVAVTPRGVGLSVRF